MHKEDIRFGIKESTKDIARVMGRMFDGIAFRGFEHELVESLAEYARVPVWNGLSDSHHPTQALADLLTIREEFGKFQGIKIAYVGDGRNNMARSLMIAAGKTGLDLRIIAPTELQPDKRLVAETLEVKEHRSTSIAVTSDLREGLSDCDVVYGDVWVSMGEESLIQQRIALLRPYRITRKLLDMTGKDHSIYLHCMPALHDDSTEMARQYPDLIDVTDEVFEGPQSRVFEQAENRMHSIKALMVATVA